MGFWSQDNPSTDKESQFFVFRTGLGRRRGFLRAHDCDSEEHKQRSKRKACKPFPVILQGKMAEGTGTNTRSTSPES
jgi:hypothetical protein